MDKSGENTESIVLAYFFADWCGPCDHLKPVLKEFAEKMGEEVKIVHIDIDKDQMSAAAFMIRTVPTLILFRDGQSLWKYSGQITSEKLLETIRQKIENHKL